MQNVIGSLFNSHLFDFTHGWTYVIGVGIAGGTVLKNRARGLSASTTQLVNYTRSEIEVDISIRSSYRKVTDTFANLRLQSMSQLILAVHTGIHDAAAAVLVDYDIKARGSA